MAFVDDVAEDRERQGYFPRLHGVRHVRVLGDLDAQLPQGRFELNAVQTDGEIALGTSITVLPPRPSALRVSDAAPWPARRRRQCSTSAAALASSLRNGNSGVSATVRSLAYSCGSCSGYGSLNSLRASKCSTIVARASSKTGSAPIAA